jgi:autotransporter translocation and assembly factor TamB
VLLPKEGAIRATDVDGQIALEAGSVNVGTFVLDAARLVATAAKGNVAVRDLSIKRGSNSIAATARAQLPADLARTDQIAGEVQLAVRSPQLAEFGFATNGQVLSGQLELEAGVRFVGVKVDGDVRLDGGLALGDFRTHELGAQVQLRGNTVQIEQFTFALNDKDRLTLKGRFETAQPQLYEGTLALGIRDLAALQPLLAVFGVKEALHGELAVNWSGTGAFAAGQNDGKASITLKDAKYGATELNEFTLGGSYTGESANAELRAESGSFQLKSLLSWSDEHVMLRDLELKQGGQRTLTGEISYGLAGLGGAHFEPLKQAVSVSLQAENLDLEKVLGGFVKPAPASGRVTFHLAASGTPLRPEVDLKVEGRALKAKAAAQIDAADLDLTLHYQPGALSLDATARQQLVQPIVVKARVPLDVEKLATERKLDPALPLDVSVKLPPTSLAVLPKFVPQIRRAEGTAALDLQIAGTAGQPQFNGAATIALQHARLVNENVPGIGKFDAKLVFTKEALSFERFSGEIGGGTFALGGKVGLADFKDPIFDLQLKANGVLVRRDDSITVRTDADVKVAGPLHAGSVSGELNVVQSRFFKEIDILPIALPGKPKPVPKTAPTDVNISLPPPLDAWKFDLAIKTREDDPFRIRGNLANGRVSLNLLLGGEGKQPWLEGMVTIDQFTGSLPFSTITVESGHVYFTRNEPFQPTLDIQAESKIRDYTVTAYVYGNAREPQLQLTSEPPMPHADIVSLLATGTTTGELTGSADILASRAAIYAIESLWRKVFKRKALPKEEAANRNDANFADRFNLELGGLDQKTGAREASARFKLNEQTYILGELDTQGRYTGSLKYLLRFR